MGEWVVLKDAGSVGVSYQPSPIEFEDCADEVENSAPTQCFASGLVPTSAGTEAKRSDARWGLWAMRDRIEDRGVTGPGG